MINSKQTAQGEFYEWTRDEFTGTGRLHHQNDELKQTIHRYGGALMNAMKIFLMFF